MRSPEREKGGLEELPDLRVPHVVLVNGVDSRSDANRDSVPAELVGVVGVEVVLAVGAGAAAVFNDVLVVMADNDGEIAVLLDAALADGLDSLMTAVIVDGDDSRHCIGGQLTGGFEVGHPLLDISHIRATERGDKTASASAARFQLARNRRREVINACTVPRNINTEYRFIPA
ncbi:unknown [Haloarcula marismortui ATCC 43049]|uniref:Uncharacterized protein n=1 Tax=Haloarcula marismortui (strain ATCC 43049 / DSM 3752 / JCM 8966 / VKM B-1809) TaxID=272569 RepID=Q5UYV6_HALMA|nr:unknown [Haloarcula marismortui ATCC 43049]